MRFILCLCLLISSLISACNLSSPASSTIPTVSDVETIAASQTPTEIIPTRTNIPSTAISNVNIGSASPANTGTVICNKQTTWDTYTIIAGDTMFNIAQRGNTTVDNLVSANCLVDASLISAGQVLYVPSPIQSSSNTQADQDFLQYWLISEVDSPLDGIKVGCESYIVPMTTTKVITGNTVEDLTTALNDLLAPNQQYPDRVTNYILKDQNLFVDSITIDKGHATIQIGGQLYGLGTCADPIFEGQIIQTIFQFEEIQSTTVMNGEMNLRQFVDMSGGLELKDYIYTR